jgi:hypothetical protein
MPAQAGIHDLPSLYQRKSWISAGACPRTLDPGAGMTRRSTEESIIPLPLLNRRNHDFRVVPSTLLDAEGNTNLTRIT